MIFFKRVYILLVHKMNHACVQRTPETDSTNPWGSIESRLRTTGLDSTVAHIRYDFKRSFYILTVLTYLHRYSERDVAPW